MRRLHDFIAGAMWGPEGGKPCFSSPKYTTNEICLKIILIQLPPLVLKSYKINGVRLEHKKSFSSDGSYYAGTTEQVFKSGGNVLADPEFWKQGHKLYARHSWLKVRQHNLLCHCFKNNYEKGVYPLSRIFTYSIVDAITCLEKIQQHTYHTSFIHVRVNIAKTNNTFSFST